MTETRARRRIREAVESRGYAIESISYEPWYNAGEMMGIGGGWFVELDRPYLANCIPGNELGGLSVEEVLADVDYWLKPDSPCACDLTRNHPIIAAGIKGDPQRPTHDADCPHHIKYRLRWWTKADGGAGGVS
jgi:hypothetical protein